MNRGPQLVLALGLLLAGAMLMMLWFTSVPSRSPGPPEDAPVAAAAPRPSPSPATPLPSSDDPRPAQGQPPEPAAPDAGRRLIPGRDIPLPPDQWPERLRPKTREVATPQVEDVPPVRKEDIRAAIEAVKPLIKQCFLDAAEKNAGDQKVVLKFTIVGQGTSGHFQDGEVESSTIPDPWTQACFLEALTDARFPAPEGGGTVTVTYPFAFTDTRDAGTD